MATVFTFFVYSPWLLVTTVASIGLDFFILRNPEYFQKADEWVAKTVQQFKGNANQPNPVPPTEPKPIEHIPIKDVAEVTTYPGLVLISLTRGEPLGYHVALDPLELYKHIKLADGSPLVKTKDAFYFQPKIYIESPIEKEPNDLQDVQLPIYLPSDLFEGVKEGEHVKFLWKDRFILDLDLGKTFLENFRKLKSQAHSKLPAQETSHLSPEFGRVVFGEAGVQKCQFDTLSTTLQLVVNEDGHAFENTRGLSIFAERTKVGSSDVIRLKCVVPGLSQETLNENLWVICDEKQLWICFSRPDTSVHYLNGMELIPSLLDGTVELDKIEIQSCTDGILTILIPMKSAAPAA